MENQLHVDRKITNFNRKTNATFILPSNDFQDSQTKRERVRESSSTSTLLTRSKTQITPHLSQALASPDHAAPSPRSRAGQASSFFSLLPQHRRHLDQSLASCSRRHHPRPISSPPLKTDLSFPIYLSFPQSLNLSLFDL